LLFPLLGERVRVRADVKTDTQSRAFRLGRELERS